MLDRVRETYDTELASKEFAYDGEKSLFTVGSLPHNKHEFVVVLEDVTSSRYVWYLFFSGCDYFTSFVLSLYTGESLHTGTMSHPTMVNPALEMKVIGKG